MHKVINVHETKNNDFIGSPSWDQDVHLPAKDPITIDKT
jgi:hypothetical protein